MCRSVLQDPAFFSWLFRIDQEFAEAVRAQGCACGGRLHCADYERKPRGIARGLAGQTTTRLDFCCAACRHRTLPKSVRFLGRRVYWGVVVVLATALCAGLSLRRGRQLSEQLGVPVLTVERWRRWWQSEFPHTALWRGLRGRFLPPVCDADLPADLLARVVATEPAAALVTILRWLAPLGTLAEG
jgi:hypothetical protein